MRAAFLLVILARAMSCCTLMMLTPPAQSADKGGAGTLGGQAPRWPFDSALHTGFFAAEGLAIDLRVIQSGAAVVQQLAVASLDVGLSVGITNPIHAIDKGASLALI